MSSLEANWKTHKREIKPVKSDSNEHESKIKLGILVREANGKVYRRQSLNVEWQVMC